MDSIDFRASPSPAGLAYHLMRRPTSDPARTWQGFRRGGIEIVLMIGGALFISGLLSSPAQAEAQVPAIDPDAPLVMPPRGTSLTSGRDSGSMPGPAGRPTDGIEPTDAPPPVNLTLGREARLSAREQKGVKLADEWINSRDMPTRGEDGDVVFVYGATLPSVVCKPLFVCDIALQAGEEIQQIDVGDKVRWRISPASSGSGAQVIPHLLVKPTDSALDTNLVVGTDRRVYHIKLVSSVKHWMPRVAFQYPEDVDARMAAYHDQLRARRAALPSIGSEARGLDFDFAISGDMPRWRPLRVYTDGIKTYIQFPAAMAHDEAPALVALGPNAVEQLVNYRKLGDRYIVDKVLDRAALIMGVGREQIKVDIIHTGGDGS